MDQFHNMLSRDVGAPALFYALVIVIIIALVWCMMPSEGVTAGGPQVLAQPYFESGGGRYEAFQSRSQSGMKKAIHENMTLGPVQSELANEGRVALLNKLGCEVDAQGNYAGKPAPSEAWGWLRQQAKSGKKENLSDDKLSATMAGM